MDWAQRHNDGLALVGALARPGRTPASDRLFGVSGTCKQFAAEHLRTHAFQILLNMGGDDGIAVLPSNLSLPFHPLALAVQ